MRLLIINPNTTAAMTERVAKAARSVALPGTEIIAVNPHCGPAAIQGSEDGERALPGLFAVFDEQMNGTSRIDALIMALSPFAL